MGVATEILISFRISDGLPLAHPGENSQDESVTRLLPPLCSPPAYLAGGEPCHWGEYLRGGWQRHYQAL